MTKNEITKRIDKMQDCISEIRCGWAVEMNITVLKLEAEELARKYKEGMK